MLPATVTAQLLDPRHEERAELQRRAPRGPLEPLRGPAHRLSPSLGYKTQMEARLPRHPARAAGRGEETNGLTTHNHGKRPFASPLNCL